jgi:plasmid stabilization system protein ParE
MIGYRFLSPAEDEMSEAALFYEAATIGLGTDFLTDIQQRIDALRQFPKTGTPITPELRRMLLHRFPFSIIYSEETNAIVIVSIAHHRKRPGYWQSRLDRDLKQLEIG